jgi:prepilin-type N-terminal cleavage/methylation domain-containing protein
MLNRAQTGFTLAELLIALAILGELATFTIPKILTAQQSTASRAKAKEVAGMISGAYQMAQFNGIVTSSTKPSDLTPYMNYVKMDTSGTLVDAHPMWAGTAGGGASACVAGNPCIKLQNGGTLFLQDDTNFGGTSTLNVIAFSFDPDGTSSGTTNDGSGKAIQFELYYNGQLSTRGTMKSGSTSSAGAIVSFNSGYDPSWFSW